MIMCRVLLVAIAAGLVMMMGAPVMAARPRREAAAVPAGSITDEDVRRAIEKGREWLINQQTGGQWPEKAHWHQTHLGGHSELVTMTLLYTGSHPVNSAVMSRALTFLMGQKLDYTYAVCCRTMAYAYALKGIQSAGPKKDQMRLALRDDAQWLVNAQWPNGGWSYRDKSYPHRIDFSNTQFAILALWEAAKAGIEIPDAVWQRTLDLYKTNQQSDGSWNYGPTRRLPATATAR